MRTNQILPKHSLHPLQSGKQDMMQGKEHFKHIIIPCLNQVVFFHCYFVQSKMYAISLVRSPPTSLLVGTSLICAECRTSSVPWAVWIV